jgi:hypothetical protein
MHTFRQREGDYEVGFYYTGADGIFHRLFTVGGIWEAMHAVSYLNGGGKDAFSVLVKSEKTQD